MGETVIPALCVVLGLAVGWFARGWLNRGPRGYAVLCDDLWTAATVWRPGLRVFHLGAHGAQALAEAELVQAKHEARKGL